MKLKERLQKVGQACRRTGNFLAEVGEKAGLVSSSAFLPPGAKESSLFFSLLEQRPQELDGERVQETYGNRPRERPVVTGSRRV